jgi:hypothetical protein
MEDFVIAVIRRAALELENYARTGTPIDEIDVWVAWVADRAVASAPTSKGENPG